MRFLTTLPGYKTALASDSNYPHGHIYKLDGSPAIFVCKNKIDLGLIACRDRVMQDTINNVGSNATVYGRTNNEYNPQARSTFSTATRDQAVRAAYNSLDIAFREEVLPNTKCRDFNFFDMIMGRGNEPAFQINRRQHLVYRLNDHFDNPNLSAGIRGHADDSLFQNERWVRNDPGRTFVGLLYLTTQTPDAREDSQTEFSGGDLRFPLATEDGVSQYFYHPKFSQMIFFPASPMYLHAVPKITAGTRIVVTTWYTVPGY